MTPPRIPHLLACWLILVSSTLAAEREVRQGHAVLRLQADHVEAGQVKSRLSSPLTITVTIEGDAPLEFNKGDTALEQEQFKALQASEQWHSCEVKTQRSYPAEGRERWQQTILLDPLKPCEGKVQLVPLNYSEGPKKKPHSITWQPISVTITTEVVHPDLKELRDNPGPEELPPLRSWWLPWLIGLAAVVVGAGLIVGGWELKRRWKTPEPPPLPHEWALREMDRIEAMNLGAGGQTERYHTLLSDVLRRYFELRFQLPASKQTTQEFLEKVPTLPELSSTPREQLREFLQRCDLAKFAPFHPTPEECQTTASLARQVVEYTLPITEPSPE